MNIKQTTLLSTSTDNASTVVPDLSQFKYINDIGDRSAIDWHTNWLYHIWNDEQNAAENGRPLGVIQGIQNEVITLHSAAQSLTNWLYHIDYTPGSSSPPPSYSNKDPNTPGHLQNLHASITGLNTSVNNLKSSVNNLNDFTANMSTNYGDRIYNLEQSNVNNASNVKFFIPGKSVNSYAVQYEDRLKTKPITLPYDCICIFYITSRFNQNFDKQVYTDEITLNMQYNGNTTSFTACDTIAIGTTPIFLPPLKANTCLWITFMYGSLYYTPHSLTLHCFEV